MLKSQVPYAMLDRIHLGTHPQLVWLLPLGNMYERKKEKRETLFREHPELRNEAILLYNTREFRAWSDHGLRCC